MARIRPDGEGEPSHPDELLARARARGGQIRRRRHIWAAGAGGLVVAGLAAVVLVVAWPGPTRPVVQVGTAPSSAAPTPSSTRPTAPPQRATTTSPRPTASTTPSPTRPPSTVTTTVPTTTTPSGSKPPETIRVASANNGATVSVPVGSTLVVTLSADNWTIKPAANPAVLALTGPPSQTRAPHCIPGGTCGTTTAAFRADQPGRTQVTASRAYCGEAIMCRPATDSWSITVDVTSG